MANRGSGFSGSYASTRRALSSALDGSCLAILPTYFSMAAVSRAAMGTYKHGRSPEFFGIRMAYSSIGHHCKLLIILLLCLQRVRRQPSLSSFLLQQLR